MCRIIFLLTLLGFISFSATAQQPEWYRKIKEITLLSDNYKDLFRVFDQGPKAESELEDIFRRDAELDIPGGGIAMKVSMWNIDLPDGTVQFMVHRGPPCAGGSMSVPGWNIPEGTITGLTFIPAFKKQITVDQLPFFLDFFETREDQVSTTYYSNRTEGIEVKARGNILDEVNFYPREDMWFMRCHGDEEAEIIRKQ
jgi:hypothetical protein